MKESTATKTACKETWGTQRKRPIFVDYWQKGCSMRRAVKRERREPVASFASPILTTGGLIRVPKKRRKKDESTKKSSGGSAAP